MVAVQPRRFIVSEYHRMSELGILHPTERTELIAGEIISMAAKGTAHASAVLLTQDLFKEGLGRRVFVKSQDPIHLSDTSEPEPDIVIARRDPLAYSTHHPTPAEILLVIEVADSSLNYDLKTKAPLYAQARIADYWVLDVIARQLYVFRQPAAGQYQSQTILAESLKIAPLAFTDFVIQVAQMLPPQISP
ncbi:Uma2 family endonuclease [Sphaerothrix gracilis]|uniref:Uma2 family endonuclease n=1 Tax=Sphaerothrix gracilis TaxID=3151835 RepID=UPI0031FCDC0D